MKSIHTSHGSVITVAEEPDSEGGLAVWINNPDALESMRTIEVGRIIQGGFQSLARSGVAFHSETLRAIAILTEENSK